MDSSAKVSMNSGCRFKSRSAFHYLAALDKFLASRCPLGSLGKMCRMCNNNRSISSPDIRSFCSQPPGVACYHGSAMSVVVLRCRGSYYKEQWMTVDADVDLVNRGRTTSRNGQASRCRHCCASQMTKLANCGRTKAADADGNIFSVCLHTANLMTVWWHL